MNGLGAILMAAPFIDNESFKQCHDDLQAAGNMLPNKNDWGPCIIYNFN